MKRLGLLLVALLLLARVGFAVSTIKPCNGVSSVISFRTNRCSPTPLPCGLSNSPPCPSPDPGPKH